MSSKKEAASGLPQINVSFLAYSKSWNVKGRLNLRIVRQMIKNPGF